MERKLDLRRGIGTASWCPIPARLPSPRIDSRAPPERTDSANLCPRFASLARKIAYCLEVSPTPFGGFESRPPRKENEDLARVGLFRGRNDERETDTGGDEKD